LPDCSLRCPHARHRGSGARRPERQRGRGENRARGGRARRGEDGARSRRTDDGRIAPGAGKGLAHLLAQSRRFRLANDPRLAAARAALPAPLAGWSASAIGGGTTIALKLVPPAGAAAPGAIRFFPYQTDRVDPSGPQPVTRDGDAYVLTLPVAPTLSGPLDRI